MSLLREVTTKTLLLLVGLAAATASLPWQLTRTNYSAPLAFMLVLLILGTVDLSTTLESNSTLWLLFASVAVLLLRACVQTGAMDVAVMDWLSGTALWSGLFVMNRQFPAELWQASLVYAAGPVLLILASYGDRPRRLLPAFRVFAILVCVAPLIQAVFGLRTFVRPDKNTQSLSGIVGFFQDPNSFAAALVLASAILLGEALRALDRSQTWRALGWSLLVTVGVVDSVLSGSRSGTLAVMVALTLTVALRVRREGSLRRSLVRGIVVASAASIVILAAIWVFGDADRDDRQITSGQRFLDVQTMSDAISGRAQIWAHTAKVIQAAPLFGVGPGMLHRSAPGSARLGWNPDGENAHSYPLQLMAELGIPPALAMMGFGWLALFAWSRRRAGATRGMHRETALASGLIAIWGLSLVSHPMVLPEIQAVHWVALGVLSGSGTAALHPGFPIRRTCRGTQSVVDHQGGA